jgi:hypothetical protein
MTPPYRGFKCPPEEIVTMTLDFRTPSLCISIIRFHFASGHVGRPLRHYPQVLLTMFIDIRTSRLIPPWTFPVALCTVKPLSRIESWPATVRQQLKGLVYSGSAVQCYRVEAPEGASTLFLPLLPVSGMIEPTGYRSLLCFGVLGAGASEDGWYCRHPHHHRRY